MNKILVIIGLLLFSPSDSHTQGYILGEKASGLLLSGGTVRIDSDNSQLFGLGFTYQGIVDVGVSYQLSKVDFVDWDFEDRVGLNSIVPYVVLRTADYTSRVFMQAEASIGYSSLGHSEFASTDGYKIIPWALGVSVGVRNHIGDMVSIYPTVGISYTRTNISYTPPGDGFSQNNFRESTGSPVFSIGTTIGLGGKTVPQVLAIQPFVSWLVEEDTPSYYGISLVLGMGLIGQ